MGQADVAVAGFQNDLFNTDDRNDIANKFKINGLFFALARDRHRNPGSFRSPHHIDSFTQIFNRLSVNFYDAVLGDDAGFERRRVLDGRYDGDKPIFHRDVDPDSGKFAFGVDLQILKRFRRQQR